MNQAEVKRWQAQSAALILGLIAPTVIAGQTGYRGVTYVLAAMWIYMVTDAVISAGVSNALGRTLRLKNAKGQYRNAAAMRRNAALFQGALGLIGALLMAVTAERVMAELFGIRYGSAILRMLAPAVFLHAVSAVLQGYSRGEGSELPAAVAGILRQIFFIGFGVMFCKMSGGYGEKVSRLLAQENVTAMYGGLGVAIAFSLSELFVVIFLAAAFRGQKRNSPSVSGEGMRTTDSVLDSVRILCAGRGADMAIRLSVLLPLPLGLLFFCKAAGAGDAALTEYGVFAAGVGLCCGIPAAAAAILQLPVCVKIVGMLRKEEHRQARQIFQSGVHIGIVRAAFRTVFVAVMAEPLSAVFCGGEAGTAAKLLACGALLIIPAVLGFFFSTFLILTGKKLPVAGAAAIADVVFIIAVTVFLNVGKAGVSALVYGGAAAMWSFCALLGALSYRQLRRKPDLLRVLVVPVLAACAAGLAGMLLEKLFTPHLGSLVSVLVCLILTDALYWTALLLLRNFKETELDYVTGGRLILSFGQLLRVF